MEFKTPLLLALSLLSTMVYAGCDNNDETLFYYYKNGALQSKGLGTLDVCANMSGYLERWSWGKNTVDIDTNEQSSTLNGKPLYQLSLPINAFKEEEIVCYGIQNTSELFCRKKS